MSLNALGARCLSPAETLTDTGGHFQHFLTQVPVMAGGPLSQGWAGGKLSQGWGDEEENFR